MTPFERSAVDRRALRSVHSGELWPRWIVMLYHVLAEECPSRLTALTRAAGEGFLPVAHCWQVSRASSCWSALASRLS